MVIPIEASKRDSLKSLFEECRYDRVLIDSVLEGHFGKAVADAVDEPQVARLDSGAFTILGGNSETDRVDEILEVAPIYYVSPQNKKWKQKLEEIFGPRISILKFTDFTSARINQSKLADWLMQLPPSFEVKQLDKHLAKRITSELRNEYFFENFQTLDDFLNRGIGFCIVNNDKIVSAATSVAQSSKAIDIEIETLPEYRRRDLGTVVGAKLVLYCLENGIRPRWLAANVVSERLALKLGFRIGETYETFSIRE